MLRNLGKLLRWALMFGGVLFCLGLFAFIFVVRPQIAETIREQNANAGFVELRSLDDVLNATGSLRPAQVINLSFQTTGRVATVAVKAGQSVKTGDLLGTLETDSLERAVEQARLTLQIQQANYDTVMRPPTAEQIARAKAALAQAKASLAQAQAQFDNQINAITTSCTNLSSLEQTLRTTETAYSNYINDGYQFDIDFRPDENSPAGRAWKSARDQYSVADANCNTARRAQSGDANVLSAQAGVDQAQAALDALLAGATAEQKAAAEAQLGQAKLSLANAEDNLANATLRSPADGVVANVNVTPGATLGAGAAGAAFVVADTSSIYVETQIDENEITRVEVGQKVRFTLQGMPDSGPLNGVVERKNLAGQTSQGVVAYLVQIAVTDTPPAYLYMTADVEIIVTTRENVLVVPTRAIRRADDGSRFITIERADGTTLDIPVEIGLSVDSVTEVRGEGLREGQKVLFENRTAGSLFGGGSR